MPVGGQYSISQLFNVQAAGDAAGTAGRFWLVNQPSSGMICEILGADFTSQLGAATVMNSSPRIVLATGSTTTAATGATQSTNAGQNGVDSTSTLSCRTANTGMTITAGSFLHTFLPVACATAVSYNPAVRDVWRPPITYRLGAGEFLLVQQPDAGTAADDRRCSITIYWREFVSQDQALRYAQPMYR